MSFPVQCSRMMNKSQVYIYDTITYSHYGCPFSGALFYIALVLRLSYLSYFLEEVPSDAHLGNQAGEEHSSSDTMHIGEVQASHP